MSERKPISNKVFALLLSLALLLLTGGFVLGYQINNPSDDVTPTAEFPYALDVPFADADYYVALMQNGTVYAVNASNWDRFTHGDFATVMQTCIELGEANGGALIQLGRGIYTLGDSYLNLTDGKYNGSITLKGMGRTDYSYTVITGSGPYMVKSNVTDWNTSPTTAFHEISNIKFLHDTPNSNAITLSLDYLSVSLNDVTVINDNSTDAQGIGIFIGGSHGNTGHTLSWNDVNVASYDVNFNVSIDHLNANNLLSYYADEIAFSWVSSAWSTITNLHIVPEDDGGPQLVDSIMLYTNYLAQGNEIVNLNIESATRTFTVCPLVFDTPYHLLFINGFFMQGTLNTTDDVLGLYTPESNSSLWIRTDTNGSAEYFCHINAFGGDYHSEYTGKTTVADGEYIAHGLFDIPYGIFITVEDDLDKTVLVGADYVNRTHFAVEVINSTDGSIYNTDDIEIYWWATVNRR